MPDVMKVAITETFGCDGELRVNLRFGRHREERIRIIDGTQGALMWIAVL
jgi:hypothetical protein